jgi:nucleotide-binding universal stress UspA family protein
MPGCRWRSDVVAARIPDLEKQRRSAQHVLLELHKKHKLTGTCRSEVGNTAFEILCRIAAEIPADLIVTSTHGRTGLKRVFLGSTAERLVQYAPCPVFVDRSTKSIGNTQPDIKKVLVPVDFSNCSLAGLTYAARFAKEVGACISVLHVVDLGPVMMTTGGGDYDSPTYIEAARRRCGDQMQAFLTRVSFDGVPVNTSAVAGFCPTGIYQTAAREGADLIIMSTHGRTGLRHVLVGGAAEHTVRYAKCSVLVVPSFSRVRKGTGKQKRAPAKQARARKSHSRRGLKS